MSSMAPRVPAGRALPGQIPAGPLLLRKIEESDSQALFDGYARDPEATRYLSWPTNTKPSQTLAFVRHALRAWGEGLQFTYTVLTKAPVEQIVGTISLRRFKPDTEFHFELGYCISRSEWGKGYGTAAVRALQEAAFQGDFILRISALVHPDNVASIRVLEKCGFDREGVMRCAVSHPQLQRHPVDVFLYGVVTNRNRAPARDSGRAS